MKLSLFLFPDVLSWERECFESLARSLAEKIPMEVCHVDRAKRKEIARLAKNEIVWVVAQRWQSAMRVLRPSRQSRVFVSVLSHSLHKPTFWGLFQGVLHNEVPHNASLLTHSPLAYRFFREIRRLPESQLAYLPLPINARAASPRPERAEKAVGTLARFSSESNLNFVLSVAHYLIRSRPELRFRIFGSGPLQKHFQSSVDELELRGRVTIEEAPDSSVLAELDGFLYAPLRNDHFLPLYWAANHRVPTVAVELPGIEQFIVDGREGFLVQPNDVKGAGELLGRLLANENLSRSMSDNLLARISRKFGVAAVLPSFEQLLFDQVLPSVQQPGEAA